MATVYKTFNQNDISTNRTLLRENIPITGSILSGNYSSLGSETNIKNYAHGMWQSVYDYPHLSSSANHIFDITVGFSNDSTLSSSTPVTQQEKKINLYNNMAQILMGHDHTGSVQRFDQDGNILAGGTKLHECIFINFARLLYKDEIQKGSFTIQLGTGSYTQATNGWLTISDAGAQNDFRVNSPAGEYGILSCSSGQATGSTNGLAGLIFYQAGVCVLTASVFTAQPTGMSDIDVRMTQPGSGDTITGSLTGSVISSSCDYIRRRIRNIQFNNTTELNSTIYFCRLNHNDFNYSSNPTYLSGSKIRVKQNTQDEPVSYITGIGLYSADGALLAIGKVSESLKKSPSVDLTLRLRVDA